MPQKSWLRQFAFVEQNTAIAEGQIAEVSSKDGKGEEGYVLSGWNTKKDGSGTALKAGDIIKSDMTVYPQWEEEKQDVITVKVNDVECGGQSLEEALNENAIDEDDVKKLEFVSGKITKEDLDFIKENNDMNINTNNAFFGKVVVATGKLENYTRDGIQMKLLELGAKPVSSVTKKTDYLIVGEKAGSKLAKAQQLGVRTLTEQEFEDMIAE